MNSNGISFLKIWIIEHFWSFAWYTPPTCRQKVVRILVVVQGKGAKTSVMLQAFFDMVVHTRFRETPLCPRVIYALFSTDKIQLIQYLFHLFYFFFTCMYTLRIRLFSSVTRCYENKVHCHCHWSLAQVHLGSTETINNDRIVSHHVPNGYRTVHTSLTPTSGSCRIQPMQPSFKYNIFV